jgi:hypothetical protein
MIYVVVETRPKTYPVYPSSKKKRSKKRRDQSDREPMSTVTGSEIVKELRVCSVCAPTLVTKQLAAIVETVGVEAVAVEAVAVEAVN